MKGRWLRGMKLAIVPVLLAAAGISCATEVATSARIEVAVSILPLVEFAESIGGEKINVTVMVPPGANAHAYEPTPSQLVRVAKAKLFVKVGSGVDFELVWMGKIIATNEDMLVVDCSKGVELIGNDSHIWLSPRNVRKIVGNIYNGLIEVDPGNKGYYTQNMAEYVKKLDDLDKDIVASLSEIRSRKFVVFHPAWGYFARDYDLEQIPIEEEGKEPTVQTITRLIELAKSSNIRVVFVSPQFNAGTAQVIAGEIDGRVVFIDPLARDYVVNMYRVLGDMVQVME